MNSFKITYPLKYIEYNNFNSLIINLLIINNNFNKNLNLNNY